MRIISNLFFLYLSIRILKYISELFDTSARTEIAVPKRFEIEYYSEGKLLLNPFHKEYRTIANTVANSWIYEDQWQGLVNENHDAPIVEIDVKLPLPYTQSYTFKHVFLANSYLQDQKNYLDNLS
jgi:hypothetical protein